MRCKKHYCDLSSTVGVCASCLRERLVILLAAQAQADSQADSQASRASTIDHRKPHAPSQQQPPLVFPRSVSPYVTRRKTEPIEGRYNFDQRFYSTPQLGRAWNSRAPPETKKKRSKFSLFTSLFGLRSDKPSRDSGVGFESSTSSPFRSRVLNGCRKKGPEVVAGGRLSCRDRGMSPEGDSTSGSGYSSESEGRRRRESAVAVPVVRKKKAGGGLGREISLCLSPLVRASPNNWGNKGGFVAADVAFSGEFRKTPPHISTASSFCKNRSRKLADFGRTRV